MLIKDDEDLRSRFRRAAVVLFQAHGFERTTAAQIACAVGVTERTFYRYYSDKRDVLFEGEAMVRSLLVAAIETAPPDHGALDTVLRSLRLFQSVLAAFRPFAKARADIIGQTPSLQEREAVRTMALIDLLAATLVARGTPLHVARLASRVGMAAFVLAAQTWLGGEGAELSDCIEHSFAELKALLIELP